MGWQDEHQRRVAGFPENIRTAHAHSSNHRQEIGHVVGTWAGLTVLKAGDFYFYISRALSGLPSGRGASSEGLCSSTTYPKLRCRREVESTL